MTHAELFTVDDVFLVGERRGLVVLPDFSVPKEGWKSCTETVRIVKPNGQEFETNASFNLTHFSICDPSVPDDRRWRVTVRFPDLKKEDLPLGAKIFAAPSTVAALR
jgi:hypothetical protein